MILLFAVQAEIDFTVNVVRAAINTECEQIQHQQNTVVITLKKRTSKKNKQQVNK